MIDKIQFMKWYIIRHGQTEYNKNGIVQGSGIDAPLNETGLKQAESFFNQNKNISFDKLYTSDLIRTHQSVEQFSKTLPINKLSCLNEINWGEKEGNKIDFGKKSDFSILINDWQNGNLDSSFKNGESPLQVTKRQKNAIDQIKSNGGKNILICMHGRAMRIFLSQLLDTPLQKMDQYEHSNLCLYVLEWNGKEFKLLVKNKAVEI